MSGAAQPLPEPQFPLDHEALLHCGLAIVRNEDGPLDPKTYELLGQMIGPQIFRDAAEQTVRSLSDSFQAVLALPNDVNRWTLECARRAAVSRMADTMVEDENIPTKCFPPIVDDLLLTMAAIRPLSKPNREMRNYLGREFIGLINSANEQNTVVVERATQAYRTLTGHGPGLLGWLFDRIPRP